MFYNPSPPYMNQLFFRHKPTYLATIVKKKPHLCCWLIKSPVVLVYHGLPFLFAGQINMFASLFSVGSFTRKWWLVHSAMGSPPVELADAFSRLLQGMYRVLHRGPSNTLQLCCCWLIFTYFTTKIYHDISTTPTTAQQHKSQTNLLKVKSR